MAKGKKTGGRKQGSRNKISKEKRELAALCLNDKREVELWEEFFSSKDPKIRWEAFKLAKMYKSGKPVQPVSNPDGSALGVTVINHVERPNRGNRDIPA